jgi:hypothetical protein
MKWEDLNLKIVALGFFAMMLIMYIMGCKSHQVNHSCPEYGHGPCHICDES